MTDTYTTTDQVDDAAGFITAQGAAPWFCWLAFNAPHTPTFGLTFAFEVTP